MSPAGAVRWLRKGWPVVLLGAGFFLLLARMGAPQDAEKETLRSQFRLPPEVALTKVRVDRKKRAPFPPDLEGCVVFSEAEFRDYVRTLDDPGVWKPVPLPHGGRVFAGPYSADALRWGPLSGARQLAWGSLSWRQAQEVRRGRLLCFAVEFLGDEGGKAAYRGVAARELAGRQVTAVFVQGLLDEDRRTLHMLIRGTRGPSGTGLGASPAR